MDVDVALLSRLQFAVAVFFHFIFVPLTLGLSVLLAVMETIYVRTGNEQYKRMTKFWGRLFLINFALGIVTGITLEFQFGTNWSRYAEYVGDIFGSLLAIEATVAFFLESTFIALWHFGWDKVSKRTHLVSIWLVAIASNLSALWIILANGWMQHPVGYHLVNGRAELENFFAVLTNPYAWGQYFHTLSGAWMLGGFFVLGVSAWHLLRRNETDFFKRSVRVAAAFTLILTLLVAVFGHSQGTSVAEYQPEKLAAMEAHWETKSGAPMYLLTWPDEQNKRNYVDIIPVPGLLSFMAYTDFGAEVKGLNSFPEEDHPPVLLSFLSFRLMVALGGLFILLALLAFLYRKDLEEHPLVSRLLVCNIPLPYLALAAGWALAEVGRQPWIVYRLMRTSEAVSPIPAYSVGISLAAFIVVYALLGIVAIFLLHKYATRGPAPVPGAAATEGGK
ncbi:MAG: cytochrome ubiquinol oxidase subunit I [Deltaproteobacteria bacterium]|jgi:cytochrome d ubiquinol oxidase subunit I|nr:cytochrome ubiquinol oxidase subunit I [Deltaproteobacteria bacterium]